MFELNKQQTFGIWYADADRSHLVNAFKCYLKAELIPHYNRIDRNGYELQNLAVNLVPTALDHPETLTELERKEFEEFADDAEWFFDTEGMFNEYDIDVYLGNVEEPIPYYSQRWASRLIKQFTCKYQDCPCYAFSVVEQYLREQLEAYIEFCNKKESNKCI